MAAREPADTPTITAPTRGALVRRVRDQVGIDREALARRAGIDVDLLAREESGEAPLDDAALDTLLLVLGHQPLADPPGLAAARPRPLGRYDAEQLAAAAAAPMGERLERALEWNAFAAELAAGGAPAPRGWRRFSAVPRRLSTLGLEPPRRGASRLEGLRFIRALELRWLAVFALFLLILALVSHGWPLIVAFACPAVTLFGVAWLSFRIRREAASAPQRHTTDRR